MHLKQEVIANFFGVCVAVDPALSLARGLMHPTIPDRVRSLRLPEDYDRCAIVLPDEYHMLTFVTDVNGGSFVYSDMNGDYVFRCQATWVGVCAVFGVDSVVHGVAYRGDARHRAGELVLGVFDASRLNGVELSDRPILERHQCVHARMHAAGKLPDRVLYHWLGYAESCYRSVERAPFESHQMLLFKDNGDCERVLGPLRIGNGIRPAESSV
jgi:hypothetical protein